MATDQIRRGQNFDIPVNLTDSGLTITGATLTTVFTSTGGHVVVVENSDHTIVDGSNYTVNGSRIKSNEFKRLEKYSFVTEFQLGQVDSWITVTQVYEIVDSSLADLTLPAPCSDLP